MNEYITLQQCVLPPPPPSPNEGNNAIGIFILMIILHVFILGRDTNTCAYIKRRLAMCARKLGRVKEAVKLMKEVMNPVAFAS